MKTLKNAGFMTEFGAMYDEQISIDVLNSQLAAADRHFQSWSYWEYKFFEDITTVSDADESFYFPNGTLQQAKVSAMSRTYAYAIQGRGVEMTFQPGPNAKFQMAFHADMTLTGTCACLPFSNS